VASLSYCFVPSSSIEEAPIQAAWVATGVALASSLIQSIVETSTEVFNIISRIFFVIIVIDMCTG